MATQRTPLPEPQAPKEAVTPIRTVLGPVPGTRITEAYARLNGGNRYTVTFAKGRLRPVKGFWSLTLYDEYHFFVPNQIKRYSVGTKNKDLKTGADGSLTIFVQADEPSDPVQRANWLPAPKDAGFSLFIRAYWPQEAITSGQWTPPPVQRAN